MIDKTGKNMVLPGFCKIDHCTEVRFARFLSGGFTNMAVINPPESKLVKRTSVHCGDSNNAAVV
jgi:hypothetical protein